jgi:hypothetical protein
MNPTAANADVFAGNRAGDGIGDARGDRESRQPHQDLFPAPAREAGGRVDNEHVSLRAWLLVLGWMEQAPAQTGFRYPPPSEKCIESGNSQPATSVSKMACRA